MFIFIYIVFCFSMLVEIFVVVLYGIYVVEFFGIKKGISVMLVWIFYFVGLVKCIFLKEVFF